MSTDSSSLPSDNFREKVLSKAVTVLFRQSGDSIVEGYFNNERRSNWALKQRRMQKEKKIKRFFGERISLKTMEAQVDNILPSTDHSSTLATGETESTQNSPVSKTAEEKNPSRRKKKEKLEEFFGDKIPNRQLFVQKLVSETESIAQEVALELFEEEDHYHQQQQHHHYQQQQQQQERWAPFNRRKSKNADAAETRLIKKAAAIDQFSKKVEAVVRRELPNHPTDLGFSTEEVENIIKTVSESVLGTSLSELATSLHSPNASLKLTRGLESSFGTSLDNVSHLETSGGEMKKENGKEDMQFIFSLNLTLSFQVPTHCLKSIQATPQ